jgi:NADH-quinone oxidoreductase subunit H
LIDAIIDIFKNQFWFSALLAVVISQVILGAVAYCIYFERKISAWMQDRVGPNRVGPLGLLQPIADGAKFLFKEDIIPAMVDKPLFLLAPVVAFSVAMLGFAVLPWGGMVDLDGDGIADVAAQVADPGIGLLYLLGLGGLSVYGVVMGGWASNNKYAFLAAMRSTAQMLSYEIPMGLAILIVVLISGHLRLEDIVLSQTGDGYWNIVHHPVAFAILLITLFAETNRTPFDLAEAEQELVGGYHTEYSALKFGMFFLGEYAHMITGSGFIVVLFLGGWHLPWVPGLQPGDVAIWAMLLKMLVMGGKIAAFIFLFMWVRWTLPRFRFDQLMRMCWKGLLPLGMVLTAYAATLVYLGQATNVVWTLGGNAVLALALLAWVGLRRGDITGRQTNMPTIPIREPAKVNA